MISKVCVQCYKYLFYKYYRWSLRVNTNRTGHETHAVLIMSGVMMFNFFVAVAAILAVIRRMTSYQVWDFYHIHLFQVEILVVVIAALVMKMNFVLLKGIGYQKIIQEFSHESPRQRTLGTVFVAFYAFGSFLLVFLSWTWAS